MDEHDVPTRPSPHEWNVFFRNYSKLRENRNRLILNDSTETPVEFVSSQQLKMRIAKYLNDTKRPMNRLNPGRDTYRWINCLFNLIQIDLLGLIYDYCPPDIIQKLDYYPTEMSWSRNPLSKFLETWKTKENAIFALSQLPSAEGGELDSFWQNENSKQKEDRHYLFVAARTFSLLHKYYYLQTSESWKSHSLLKTKAGLLQLFRTLHPDISITKKRVIILFNPENEWRAEVIHDQNFIKPWLVEHNKTGGPPYVIKKEWIATLPTEEGPVQAIIQMRRKNPLQTIAKLWREPHISDLDFVYDIHGIRLAYFTDPEMRSGVEAVRNGLKGIMGDLEHEVSRLNEHSAKWLQIVSQQAAFLKKNWEIQHITAKQMYDIEYSVGQENHTLYHRRSYTEFPNGLFYQLFPPEIYGINWADPDICKQMDEHIIRQTVQINKEKISGPPTEPEPGTGGT